MTEYVIYRHGYHEANQSAERGQPKKMAVLRLSAAGPEEACRLAARQVSLYPGQHLTAEPAAEVDAHEAELNRTARAHE
jgi:hypothetical protein